MPTELKRITFAVTPDMKEMMDEAKKMFCNKNQSEMIRALIVAGLKSYKAEKDESKDDRSA